MSLNTLLAECATALLATGRPTAEAVVECALARDPELWADEKDRLVRDAARRQVKDLLRRLSDDEEAPTEQLRLPDLLLPTAIAVRTPDGDVYYVASRNAVWEELLAGRVERVENIAAAQKKLRLYDDALAKLEPSMAAEPDLTVEGALRRMQRQS